MLADEKCAQTPVYQLPTDDLVRVQFMLAKYQTILDPPCQPDKDVIEMCDKYHDRLEAIDLRAQIRQDQGRPV